MKKGAIALLTSLVIVSSLFAKPVYATGIDNTNETEGSVIEEPDLPDIYFIRKADCEHGTITLRNDKYQYNKNQSAIFTITPETGYGIKEMKAYDSVTLEDEPISPIIQEKNTYCVNPTLNGTIIEVVCTENKFYTVSVNDIDMSDASINCDDRAVSNKEVNFSIDSDEGVVATYVTYSYFDEEKDKRVEKSCELLGDNTFKFKMPDSDVLLTPHLKQYEKHNITLKTDGLLTIMPSLSKNKAYYNDKVYLKGSDDPNIITNFECEEFKICIMYDEQAKCKYILMPDEDITIKAKEDIFNVNNTQSAEDDEDLTLDVETQDIRMSLVRLRNVGLLALPAIRSTYPDHTTTATVDSTDSELPTVTITKNAHWTDIEHGLAEVYLTEKDTKGEVNTFNGVDVAVAIDRSDSTMIDWHQLWLYSEGVTGDEGAYTTTPGDNDFASAESPCLNKQHYYQLGDGSKVYFVEQENNEAIVYDWANGDPVSSTCRFIDLNAEYGDASLIYPVISYPDPDDGGRQHLFAAKINDWNYIKSQHYDIDGNLLSKKSSEYGVATRQVRGWVPLGGDAYLSDTDLGVVGQSFVTDPTNYTGGYVFIHPDYGEMYRVIDPAFVYKHYAWSTYGCVNYSRYMYEKQFAVKLRDRLIQMDQTTGVTNPSRMEVWEFVNRQDYEGRIISNAAGTYQGSRLEQTARDSRVLNVSGVEFWDKGLVYSTGGGAATLQNVSNVDINLTNTHAGGGTDYGPSYMLAWRLLNTRTGDYATRPFVFVFLTDSDEEWCFVNGYKNLGDNPDGSHNWQWDGFDINNDGNLDPATEALNATNFTNAMKSNTMAPVTIYTIGIGMGGRNDSFQSEEWENEGAPFGHMEYLNTHISGRNALAQQMFNASGEEDSSTFFKTVTTSTSMSDAADFDTVTNKIINTIANTQVNKQEIQAQSKVFRDVVSDYYTVVGTSTSHGTITYSGNNVTWNVPNGANTTYSATIRIKLNDTYRYAEQSKTSYPTNTDSGTNYGAKMTYNVVNTTTNTTTTTGKTIQTRTPILPYGTVTIQNEGDNSSVDKTGKVFTIQGTETNSVSVTATRKVAGATAGSETVGKATATKADNGTYKWKITRRYDDDTIPLVKYNNYEEELSYEQTEDPITGYTQVAQRKTNNADGTLYEAIYENKPFNIDATLDKRDADNNNVITDAEFTVFGYQGSGDTNNIDNYKIYCYEPFAGASGDFTVKGKISYVDYDTYIANPSMYNAVKMVYDSASKKYKNTAPLYYAANSNKGYFRIVETHTPAGYYGDWKDGVTPTDTSTYKDKNSYLIQLNPSGASVQSAVVANNSDNTFTNKATKFNISIDKTGEVAVGSEVDVSGNTIIQYEEKGLPDTWYILRAAEDIYDLQRNLLYGKGDIIELKNYQIGSQTHRVKLSDLDLSVYKDPKDSTHILKVGETISDNNIVTDVEDTRVNKKGSIPTLGTYVTKTEYMADDYEYSSLLDDFTLDTETGKITFENGLNTSYVFVTDENGHIDINDLYQGKYEIVEIKATKGYVRGRGYVVDVLDEEGNNKVTRPTNSAFATCNVNDETVSEITKNVKYFNEPQKIPTTPPPTPHVDPKDNNPAISLIKKVNKEFFRPGETASYEVIVTNIGDVDLKDGIVTDIMDDDEDTLMVLGKFDHLAVGESITYNYEFTVPTTDKNGTKHENIATVNAVSVPDPENGIPEKPVSDKDDEKIKVVEGLGIIKKADKQIYLPGETVTYTVWVTNNNKITTPSSSSVEGYKQELNAKTAHELVVTDIVTTKGVGQAVYTSTDMPERVKVGTNNEVLIDYLAPGETCILHYNLEIPEDVKERLTISGNGVDDSVSENDIEERARQLITDRIDNTVIVIDKEKEKDEDDEKVKIVDPSIYLTKVARERDFDGNKIAEGEDNVAFYDITITNNGDCDLTNTVVYDVLLNEGTFLDDCVVYDEHGNISENSIPGSVSYNDAGESDSTSDTDDATNPNNTNKGLWHCEINGNSVELGDLPIGYSKTITFRYEIKDDEAGITIPNIMKVRALTPPDPDDPDTPQIPVEDEDDEYIHSGLKVGVRKVSDGESGIIDGIGGAKFGLYAAEDVKNIFGTTIIANGTLVETQITDSDGYAHFNTEQLPLGEYVVKELEPPAGCYPSNMIIYLHGRKFEYDDSVHTYYMGGVIRNEGIRLLVYLYDDNTMNELANAELEVTSVTGEELTDTWVTTNTNGLGYEVYGIKPGVTYHLHEKIARTGYVNEIVRDLSDKILESNSVDEKTISFTVPESDPEYYTRESDFLYGKIIPETEPRTYHVRITNDFVEGEVRLYKEGDWLDSWDFLDKLEHWFYSVFKFFKGPMEDIEFTITANKDIIHPDGVTGIIYHKGDVVQTGVKSIKKDAIEFTDKAGMATFKQLYLGEYTITETRGKEGWVEDAPKNVSLAFVDENTPIVYATEEGLSFYNPTQKVVINIEKRDKTTDQTLEGAEFELYADEDITNKKGDVITKKGELLESGIITGKDGKTTVYSILPVDHKYYLKEVAAPIGYGIDKENEYIPFAVFSDNYKKETIIHDILVKDTRNDDRIKVHKVAPEETAAGATLTFTIDEVSNLSRVKAERFTLTDEVPKNTYMTKLYTGTYSDEVTMIVLYKTNTSKDWKEWKRGISSKKAETLTVDSLKLKDKERIEQFAIQYGTVPAGFKINENDFANYDVKVGNIKVGEKIINNIHLTAYVDNKKLTSDHSTTTIVKKPDEPKTPNPNNPDNPKNPRTPVKTGDENWLYDIAIFEVILSFLELLGFGLYVLIQRSRMDKIVEINGEKTVIPGKYYGRKSNKPLGELTKKEIKEPKHVKKIIFYCVSKLALAMVILFFATTVYLNASEEYRELTENYIEELDVNDENQLKYDIDWDALYAINPDIVGWVVIDGTKISYPIVQASDNKTYLKTTFEGVKNACGAIFMDYDNLADFSDKNTVIYGHNMRDGSMFHELNNYKDEAFYKDHSEVWVCTPMWQRKYSIISAHTTQDMSATYDRVYDSMASFEAHVADEVQQSIYTTTGTYSKDLPILTLSTCSKRNSLQRMVVVCQPEYEMIVPKDDVATNL